MKFIENIKKHCASLELLYDFSEFKKITVLSLLRFVLRVLSLIPCFIAYLFLLIMTMVYQLMGFFASLPGQVLAKIRANPGYDNHEYKWLYILSNLLLYIAVMIFDIFLIILPCFLAVFSFALDAVLWIARLGKSRFVNVNICFNEMSNKMTDYVSKRASNRSFGEVVSILFITFFLITLDVFLSRELQFDYQDYLNLLFWIGILFFAILQIGIYIYYRRERNFFIQLNENMKD